MFSFPLGFLISRTLLDSKGMLILVLLGLAMPGSIVYGDSAAKLAVDKLELRYRAARVLKATFLERYSENGRLVRSEAGTAYFRRPGKMRWEYATPEKNLFLVDGRTAWFYVPEDHTVTRVPAKESSDWRTPIALLAGEMKLSRVCSRVGIAQGKPPEQQNDVMLSCSLRGENSAGAEEAVFLEVTRDTGDLVAVLVQDKGGVSIDFKFANWQFDPPVPDSFFRFDVPRGVAIVNGEARLGSGNSQ